MPPVPSVCAVSVALMCLLTFAFFLIPLGLASNACVPFWKTVFFFKVTSRRGSFLRLHFLLKKGSFSPHCHLRLAPSVYAVFWRYCSTEASEWKEESKKRTKHTYSIWTKIFFAFIHLGGNQESGSEWNCKFNTVLHDFFHIFLTCDRHYHRTGYNIALYVPLVIPNYNQTWK